MLRNNLAKICIFISIFLILVLNSSGSIESIDGLASLNMARNFVYHGTWNVASPTYNIGMGVYEVDGKYYSGASKGYTVAMVPVVWITKMVYERNGFTPAVNFPLESDYLLTFLASFVNPILAFVLFVLVYKLLKFISKNDGVSLFLAMVMTLTTNLLPLAKHSFVHILFTLMVVVALYCLVRFFNNKKQIWWLVILAIDFGLLKYSYNTSFALPILGLYLFGCLKLLVEWKRLEKKDFIRNVLILIAVTLRLFVVGSKLVGLDLLNLKGTFGGEGTRIDVFQGFWGQMFSPGRSIFVYSPVLILSVYWAIRKFKNIYSKLFLIMLGLYVFFYSMFDIWHGELSYGPRYLSVLIPFGIVVLAVNWTKINKIVLGLLIVLGLYVQLVGVVIPYQVQYYPDFKLLGARITDVKDREDIFEYYSIGEFIPRFSPPYRLESVLLRRLKQIKVIMIHNYNNNIDFVKNVSFPIFPIDHGIQFERFYRHALSNFYMYTNEDVSFRKIEAEVGSINQPIKNVKLCVESKCYLTNRIIQEGNKFTIDFAHLININKAKYVNFIINEDLKMKNDFEFDLYTLSFDGRPLNLLSYELANKDWFFTRGTFYYSDNTDVNYLSNVRNNEVQALINVTPDFWWVKTQIYQNLPPIFRQSFYLMAGLLVFCLLVIGGNQFFKLFFKTINTKK